VRRFDLIVVFACMVGVPVGVGAFTFVYAKGFSYLSTDPRACVNCVACADCHMPYRRVGALKVSDHWVRSPLLNISQACQPCHTVPQDELQARVVAIQDRHAALLERAARATTDMLDAIGAARKAGVGDAGLARAAGLHRRAQWRLDFVAAENSMGFHAPQELARILAEAIDYARQGQLEAVRARPRP
jgi:nitrite reductase (cytochrome c-552)